MSARPRTISLPRPRRLLLATALTASLALGLGGCGRVGVAAKVGSHTVTVDQVQNAVAGLKAADPKTFGTVTGSTLLVFLIIDPYAEQAASAAGKGVSDDTVRAALVSQAQQNGGKLTAAGLAKLGPDAFTALRAVIAMQELDTAGQGKVLAEVKAAHPSVSPRYGTFDAATGQMIPAAPNWITPTAKPSATPTTP